MDRLSILRKDGMKFFDMSYMDWHVFKDAILEGGWSQSGILQYDCVLGGVDHTTNFR